MQCGFAFMEVGLVRTKNTTNILLKSTVDACKFLFIKLILSISSNELIYVKSIHFSRWLLVVLVVWLRNSLE